MDNGGQVSRQIDSARYVQECIIVELSSDRVPRLRPNGGVSPAAEPPLLHRKGTLRSWVRRCFRFHFDSFRPSLDEGHSVRCKRVLGGGRTGPCDPLDWRVSQRQEVRLCADPILADTLLLRQCEHATSN
jgi:hypothetical protein